MQEVINFLLKNGFCKQDTNSFENDLCTIHIYDDYYEIVDNNLDSMYSDDLNIYWLIGVLTYYEYMDRDYKV